MGTFHPLARLSYFERLITERMIMSIEKEQSYSKPCHEQLRKEPDYMLSTLAHMWIDEIIRDMRREGSPPGTIESEEIYESCSNRILAGIESGNLEATYPEKRLLETSKYNYETREDIKEYIKLPPFFIIETSKYIDWARANAAGPKQLISYFIGDIETEPGECKTINPLEKEDKPLDERERQTLHAIIYALCNMQSMSPVDKGLSAKISKITDILAHLRRFCLLSY